MTNGVVPLLNLSQTLLALSLTTEGIRVAKKKKKKVKDIVGLGITSIVGISLIRETGKIISTI